MIPKSIKTLMFIPAVMKPRKMSGINEKTVKNKMD